MTGRVLVTGATGNVGREVMRELCSRGIPVRAATTSPAHVQIPAGRPARASEASEASEAGEAGEAIEVTRLDLADPTTFAPAVTGCSAMFLMRPPAITDMQATLLPFIDTARACGIRHVVFLSVAGMGASRLVPHHAVEVHLAARGQDWTCLRPGFFAQNLADAYRRDIVEDGRLYVPAGAGRVAFVDVRDVAAVAALVLAEPAEYAEHRARTYTLTGPAAVTFDEVARVLADALGRPVRYQPASVLGYARHLRRRGLRWGQLAVQILLHAGLRVGQAEAVDPTLERLLGRRGHTLAEYVRDHVAVWQAGTPASMRS
jgi:uncharacterized protein YbjT (DUF2867 family)